MTDLQQRLQQAADALPAELRRSLSQWVVEPDFDGSLSVERVEQLVNDSGLSLAQLMSALLPIAQAYARAPVSNFLVGVWIAGGSGALYAGANQEFSGVALSQTVHAEQAAITHAWLAGETSVTQLAVTASPCGHCRQFINELAGSDQLQILLPGKAPRTISDYLPDAFGPGDLGISAPLLAAPAVALAVDSNDPVVQQAAAEAGKSYAPYSQDRAGVVLVMDDGTRFSGRYAENAAFNPSMQPLQAALLGVGRRGYDMKQIRRAVLVEQAGSKASQALAAQALLDALGCEVTLESHLAAVIA